MVLMSLVSVLNLLYFYISTLRRMCAVPNMAVFCSSLTSCFPGILLTYFLNDFEIVPVAPVIPGITFVFTFHMCCIYYYHYYFVVVVCCHRSFLPGTSLEPKVIPTARGSGFTLLYFPYCV